MNIRITQFPISKADRFANRHVKGAVSGEDRVSGTCDYKPNKMVETQELNSKE